MKTKVLCLSILVAAVFLGTTYGENSYSDLPNNSFEALSAPMEFNSVGSAFRVYPSSFFQIETAITTHPTNPNIMLGAAISGEPLNYPPYSYEGLRTAVFVTTNGGTNWTGYNSIRDLTGDTIDTFGDETVAIDKDGTFIIACIVTGSPYNQVGVCRSTNSGANWSQPIIVPGVTDPDKVTLYTDNVPTSPYYGRSYLVCENLFYEDDIIRGTFLSYSTNNGSTWSTAQRISPDNPNVGRLGAYISVGPNGEVYVSWPDKGAFLGFAKSTNGGVNWTSTDQVDTLHLAGLFFLNGAIVNGLPVMDVDKTGGPRNGWIYVVSSEKKEPTVSPALYDYDLILRRSTDGGAHWTAFRVNQDNAGSFRYHIFPVINVDKDGGVNIVYFDGRNTPPNSGNDSFQVYISRSVDGGNTFEDKLISGYKFKHKPIPGLYGLNYYAGSYIGVTSGNNSVWPLWYDDHSGLYQAYTSKINLTMDVKAIPQGFYNTGTGRLNSKDTLKVYLRNSSTPYARVDSAKGIIDSVSFTASLFFKNANQGNYYLEAVQRNTITTWSAGTISYSVIPDVDYDFTANSDKAYGGNMIEVDGKWCFYSGDVNKDGYIDGLDALTVYYASSAFESGYVSTDVNGDGFVDTMDIMLTYYNSINFIEVMSP